MPTREQIVAMARTMLGTPFHHQGRVPGIGLDCAGVGVCLAKDLGIEYADVAGYAHIPSRGLFLRALDSVTDRIALADVLPGDLMSFRWDSEAQHIAVVTETDPVIMILHALAQARKVVEHRFDEVWMARLIACHRMRGVD